MSLHPQLNEFLDEILPIVQHFHCQNMFSPHAASIDNEGKCTGRALIADSEHPISVAQAIDYFEKDFLQLATEGKIQASGIFYHSPGIKISMEGSSVTPEGFNTSHDPDRLFLPAETVDECHVLVVLLEHAAGDSAQVVYPYTGQPPLVDYQKGFLITKPANVFIG